MAPLPVTFSDLEGYFGWLKNLCLTYLGTVACIIYDLGLLTTESESACGL